MEESFEGALCDSVTISSRIRIQGHLFLDVHVKGGGGWGGAVNCSKLKPPFHLIFSWLTAAFETLRLHGCMGAICASFKLC